MTTRRFKEILTNRVKNKKNNQFKNRSKRVTHLNVNLGGLNANNSFKIRKHCTINNFKVEFNGNNNSLTIEEGTIINDCFIIIGGDNNHIHIGKWNDLRDVLLIVAGNSKFSMGDSNNFEKSRIISMHNGDIEIGSHNRTSPDIEISSNIKKITICDDCLIASNTVIRDSDSHQILDNKDKLLNQPKDVVINNHVWIGNGAMILKGVEIPYGCVIGAMALITKSVINEKCIVVGKNKVIKENISWRR